MRKRRTHQSSSKSEELSGARFKDEKNLSEFFEAPESVRLS
jgi:hypothetical protein